MELRAGDELPGLFHCHAKDFLDTLLQSRALFVRMAHQSELTTGKNRKIIEELTCKHCGHAWFPNPRAASLPRRCPKCGNTWNNEPERSKWRKSNEMKYAMYLWVTGTPTGIYERYDDKSFASHLNCANSYRVEIRKWAKTGQQFKIKRVR